MANSEEVSKSEVQDSIGDIDEKEEARLLGIGEDEADSKSESQEEDKNKVIENEQKVDGDNTDVKEDAKSEEIKEEESKDSEKVEEKGTTETLMEIDGKKVKKTTGGAKKVIPASVYKSSDRDSPKRKRVVGLRRRTLLLINVTVDDMLNEKIKNAIATCYRCQIRFLQTKIGNRGIVECRFNNLEDVTKAEAELKEIVVEERTIGIRNLEDRDAPSTWYEVGKELDRHLKGGDVGKDDSEKKDGEKVSAEKPKANQEDDLAVYDDAKTIVILNLPLTTTEEMLQAIFSEAQKISMPLDNTGQCKGHAFLEFETAEITTECQTKYEGISIEDDQDDRQLYIQTIKEYKEKSKAKAEKAHRNASTRRSRGRDGSNQNRRIQSNRGKRLPIRSRIPVNRGRDRNWGQNNWGQNDRNSYGQGGRRDNMNMMWNSDMINNMPNLLNMMGGMNASMMGMKSFMGNMINLQSQQRDNSNRNVDNDFNRNRKRKMDDQDFYRDNRRGGGSDGVGSWKSRRFDNQDSYGASGNSYMDRDRGNRGRIADRNVDNRGFRRSYNY